MGTSSTTRGAIAVVIFVTTMVVPVWFFNRLGSIPPENETRKTQIYPRVCTEKDYRPTWILFMGDSNMRHTYYWWTKDYRQEQAKVKQGSTFGLDRTDLDFGGRWADQELLYEDDPCNQTKQVSEDSRNRTLSTTSCNHRSSIVRLSFRFLHGSITEFVHDAQHWDVARIGASPPDAQDVVSVVNGSSPGTSSRGSDDDLSINWTRSIRPSDYAVWATKHQVPVDNNSQEFNAWMAEWHQKQSPDIVILTQGWGGIPRSDEIDIVKAVMQDNPETLFVWAPMYVTNRSPERYARFVQTNFFQWSEHNLHTVDLWDLTKQLPYDPNKEDVYHAPVGGVHMQKCMERIWRATKCRNSTD